MSDATFESIQRRLASAEAEVERLREVVGLKVGPDEVLIMFAPAQWSDPLTPEGETLVDSFREALSSLGVADRVVIVSADEQPRLATVEREVA